MRDLQSIVVSNVRATFRAAANAERKGDYALARDLRTEARELARQHGVKTGQIDGSREKDDRRKEWERKKGNKAKFWRDR